MNTRFQDTAATATSKNFLWGVRLLESLLFAQDMSYSLWRVAVAVHSCCPSNTGLTLQNFTFSCADFVIVVDPDSISYDVW